MSCSELLFVVRECMRLFAQELLAAVGRLSDYYCCVAGRPQAPRRLVPWDIFRKPIGKRDKVRRRVG